MFCSGAGFLYIFILFDFDSAAKLGRRSRKMREMISEATRTIEDSQTAQALHGLLSLKSPETSHPSIAPGVLKESTASMDSSPPVQTVQVQQGGVIRTMQLLPGTKLVLQNAPATPSTPPIPTPTTSSSGSGMVELFLKMQSEANAKRKKEQEGQEAVSVASQPALTQLIQAPAPSSPAQCKPSQLTPSIAKQPRTSQPMIVQHQQGTSLLQLPSTSLPPGFKIVQLPPSTVLQLQDGTHSVLFQNAPMTSLPPKTRLEVKEEQSRSPPKKRKLPELTPQVVKVHEERGTTYILQGSAEDIAAAQSSTNDHGDGSISSLLGGGAEVKTQYGMEPSGSSAAQLAAAVWEGYDDVFRSVRQQVDQLKTGIEKHTMKSMIDKVMADSIAPPDDTQLGRSGDIYWQQFKTRFSEIVSQVALFARKIPGFQEVSIEDQIQLIKHGSFEVSMVV